MDGVRVRGPVRLRDGSRLMLGDYELVVERRRLEVGASMVRRESRHAPAGRAQPRVRYVAGVLIGVLSL